MSARSRLPPSCATSSIRRITRSTLRLKVSRRSTVGSKMNDEASRSRPSTIDAISAYERATRIARSASTAESLDRRSMVIE